MSFHKILCPTDFSEGSRHALRLAIEQAGPDGQILLIHVWQPPYVYGPDAGLSGTSFVETRTLAEDERRPLLRVIPRGQAVTMLQRGHLGAEGVRLRLIEELQRGPMLVNYVGHGSARMWAGDKLRVDYLQSLSSARLTAVLAMTCLNGYFQDPVQDSLGEVLLKTPAGGAAAVWSSSGLTEMEDQVVIDRALLQQLFAGLAVRLGDAILAAIAATADPNVRATWVLLGDPTCGCTERRSPRVGLLPSRGPCVDSFDCPSSASHSPSSRGWHVPSSCQCCDQRARVTRCDRPRCRSSRRRQRCCRAVRGA